MKAVVAAFNQEKALVGAFSVITNLRMQLFEALHLARLGPRPGLDCVNAADTGLETKVHPNVRNHGEGPY